MASEIQSFAHSLTFKVQWTKSANCIWGIEVIIVSFPEKIVKHIRLTRCDDVFKAPFWVERFDHSFLLDDSLNDYLINEIKLALNTNPPSTSDPQKILIPKSRYNFREAAYLNLPDTLKYTALVFELGDLIESKRLGREIVFSNRFQPNEDEMLDRKGWDKFKHESTKISKSGKYTAKIVTDIANYYDQLKLHKLENILLKEIHCPEPKVKKLNQLLIKWSNNESYGLPVGSDASRLLAEAMLVNVDKKLFDSGIRFVRYVDDYRLFAENHIKAYEYLLILTKALSREGLFLNSGKTEILPIGANEKYLETELEFKNIDVNEKIEKKKIIHNSYNSQKIVRFYELPGLEAIKELQKINLAEEASSIEQADRADEARLIRFVKAVIYSETPDFSYLISIGNIYPHLLPYICHGIRKELDVNPTRFSSSFKSEASVYFIEQFKQNNQNDYFRLQFAMVLIAIDPSHSEFVSSQVTKIDGKSQILISQLISLLADRLQRNDLLELIDNVSSYGEIVQLAIINCLKFNDCLGKDEKKAKINNLKRKYFSAYLNTVLCTKA